MSDPTPPAVSEAMREAVAQWLKLHFGLVPNAAKRFAGYFCADNGPIASEIDRLTGERDAALAQWTEMAELVCDFASEKAPQAIALVGADRDDWRKRAFAAEAALSRLQADRDAEVGRLRAALEPFAREADFYEDEGPPLRKHYPDEDGYRSDLSSIGDLRRARAALTETPDA